MQKILSGETSCRIRKNAFKLKTPLLILCLSEHLGGHPWNRLYSFKIHLAVFVKILMNLPRPFKVKDLIMSPKLTNETN